MDEIKRKQTEQKVKCSHQIMTVTHFTWSAGKSVLNTSDFYACACDACGSESKILILLTAYPHPHPYPYPHPFDPNNQSIPPDILTYQRCLICQYAQKIHADSQIVIFKTHGDKDTGHYKLLISAKYTLIGQLLSKYQRILVIDYMTCLNPKMPDIDKCIRSHLDQQGTDDYRSIMGMRSNKNPNWIQSGFIYLTQFYQDCLMTDHQSQIEQMLANQTKGSREDSNADVSVDASESEDVDTDADASTSVRHLETQYINWLIGQKQIKIKYFDPNFYGSLVSFDPIWKKRHLIDPKIINDKYVIDLSDTDQFYQIFYLRQICQILTHRLSSVFCLNVNGDIDIINQLSQPGKFNLLMFETPDTCKQSSSSWFQYWYSITQGSVLFALPNQVTMELPLPQRCFYFYQQNGITRSNSFTECQKLNQQQWQCKRFEFDVIVIRQIPDDPWSPLFAFFWASDPQVTHINSRIYIYQSQQLLETYLIEQLLLINKDNCHWEMEKCVKAETASDLDQSCLQYNGSLSKLVRFK